MKLTGLIGLPSRLRYQLRRDGLKGTAGKVLSRVRGRLYLDETHVWFELPFDSGRRRAKAPEGVRLIRAGVGDLRYFEQLPAVVGMYQARSRLQDGHDLWMALEGEKAAFACWTFRGALPVFAAPGGCLLMPPEIVGLEDSIASPEFRGRSIAPATWSFMADTLEEEGVGRVVTKCLAENTAVRRAAPKVGMREFATVRHRRMGPKRRTILQTGEGPAADWLARQFAR